MSAYSKIENQMRKSTSRLLNRSTGQWLFGAAARSYLNRRAPTGWAVVPTGTAWGGFDLCCEGVRRMTAIDLEEARRLFYAISRDRIHQYRP